jgi:hypothetical protein
MNHNGAVQEVTPTFSNDFVRWPAPALEPSTLYSVQIIRKVVSSEQGTVQDSFRDLDLRAGEGNSARVREQKVARNTIRANESVVFSLHFSTSRYSTYTDKLADATTDAATEFIDTEWYTVAQERGYKPFVLETKEPFTIHDAFRFKAALGQTSRSTGSQSFEISAVPQSFPPYGVSQSEYVSDCSKPYTEETRTYTVYTRCYAMWAYSRMRSGEDRERYRKLSQGHDGGYSNGDEFVSYMNKRAIVQPSFVSYQRPGDNWNYRASSQIGLAPQLSAAEIDKGVLNRYENGRIPLLYAMPIYAVKEHRKAKKYLRAGALFNKYRGPIEQSLGRGIYEKGSLSIWTYLNSSDAYDMSSMKSYIAEYDDTQGGGFFGGGFVDEGSITLDDVFITDEEVPDFISDYAGVVFRQPLGYDRPDQDWVIITPPQGEPVRLMFEF